MTLAVSGPPSAPGPPSPRFTVRLDAFTGPFDLLLQLIGRHELDVTELALHRVTDDFIAHLSALGDEADLDETTEFLVIAATLLDLKAARLLPDGDVDDPEDIALLEARDLLFARLLQYRAYQQAAALFVELEAGALRRFPRAVALEARYAALLPEVEVGVDAAAFAQLGAAAFRPKPPPEVSLEHLHLPRVSVPEQMAELRARISGRGRVSFAELVSDCERTLDIVARFLAVLELYRESEVRLEQTEAFGMLVVTWNRAPSSLS